MANIDITRRAVIGAIALSPAIGLSGASLANPDYRGMWDALFTRWQNADQAFSAYDNAHFPPTFDPSRYDPPRHVYEMADALASDVSDLEARLMGTPAPDNAALYWKLERALDGGGDWRDEIMDTLRADAKRLLAAGRA